MVVSSEAICYNPRSSSALTSTGPAVAVSSTAPNNDASPNNSGPPQGGIIAGVVIAGVVAVSAIIGLAVYWDRTRGRTRGRLPGKQITDFGDDQTHIDPTPPPNPTPYNPPQPQPQPQPTDRGSLLRGGGRSDGSDGSGNRSGLIPAGSIEASAVYIGEEKPTFGEERF